MSRLVQELTHKKYNEGSRRQEGREREGQNSGEQRHEEICGMEKDGAGIHGVNKMDKTKTFMSLHDRDFQEGKQGI